MSQGSTEGRMLPTAPSPNLGRLPRPWKAASVCQEWLAFHKTMSPLLTGEALLNICKRNKVENSTCVGGGRARDLSTTLKALFLRMNDKETKV